MKKAEHATKPTEARWLDIDEVRLVSDLRIMHAKVDELYQIVSNLKRRHNGGDIHKYADHPLLNEDIARVDDIYGWFVGLKDHKTDKRAM
ncbi:MAG: hypothetical protein WA655_18770 [Candidatus Korobacteraceae bacterium]